MPTLDLTEEEIGVLATLLNGIAEGDVTPEIASIKGKIADSVKPAPQPEA